MRATPVEQPLHDVDLRENHEERLQSPAHGSHPAQLPGTATAQCENVDSDDDFDPTLTTARVAMRHGDERVKLHEPVSEHLPEATKNSCRQESEEAGQLEVPCHLRTRQSSGNNNMTEAKTAQLPVNECHLLQASSQQALLQPLVHRPALHGQLPPKEFVANMTRIGTHGDETMPFRLDSDGRTRAAMGEGCSTAHDERQVRYAQRDGGSPTPVHQSGGPLPINSQACGMGSEQYQQLHGVNEGQLEYPELRGLASAQPCQKVSHQDQPICSSADCENVAVDQGNLDGSAEPRPAIAGERDRLRCCSHSHAACITIREQAFGKKNPDECSINAIAMGLRPSNEPAHQSMCSLKQLCAPSSPLPRPGDLCDESVCHALCDSNAKKSRGQRELDRLSVFNWDKRKSQHPVGRLPLFWYGTLHEA